MNMFYNCIIYNYGTGYYFEHCDRLIYHVYNNTIITESNVLF